MKKSNQQQNQTKIGFIGQGWIGKNYADDFEARGFSVVRYAKTDEYIKNKQAIADCGIVFIAVPTPTKETGFDASILRQVFRLIGKGNIAVIKSTIIPGTTAQLQKENKNIIVLHSPEFLTEASASHDASHPARNIIGMPIKNTKYLACAKRVLSVLPKAPYKLLCSSNEAELIKYAHNIHGFFRIMLINFIYDLAKNKKCKWETINSAITADPFFSVNANYYNNPIHKKGRGAGGHCFIKDMAAFREIYAVATKDKIGTDALCSLEKKNIDLLKKSKKDLDLLSGVYDKI